MTLLCRSVSPVRFCVFEAKGWYNDEQVLSTGDRVWELYQH
jgi:hypothetical protein